MSRTDCSSETLQLKHQLPCNGIQILAATYDTRRHHVLTYDSCKGRPYMLRIFSLRREIRFGNLFELIHHSNRIENSKPFKLPHEIQLTSLMIQYSHLNDVYICVFTINHKATLTSESFNYEYNILFLDPLTLAVLVTFPGHSDQCLQSFCYDDNSGKLVICSKLKSNPSGDIKMDQSVSPRQISGGIGNTMSYLDLIRVSKRQYQSQSDDTNDKSRIILCIEHMYTLEPFEDLLSGLCGTKEMKRLFGYGMTNEKGVESGSFIVEWTNTLNLSKGIEMLQVARRVVHPDAITCLQVSNCEKWLFTGHENGLIKAWDVQRSSLSYVNVYTLVTGPIQVPTERHMNTILSIQLSQNGIKKKNDSYPDIADEIFFFTTEENSTIVKQWRFTVIYTDRLNTTRQNNTTTMTERSIEALSSRNSSSQTNRTSNFSLTNRQSSSKTDEEELTIYLDCLGKYDGKTGRTHIKKSDRKKKKKLFPLNTLCLSVCIDMGSFNESLLLVLRDDVIHVLKVQCVVDVLLSLGQNNNIFSIRKSQNTNRLVSLTSENGSTVRYVSLDPVYQEEESDFMTEFHEQYGLVPTLTDQKAAKVTTMEHFCLSNSTQQEVIVLGWSNGTVEIYSFPDSRKLYILQDPTLNDQVSALHLVETSLQFNKEHIKEDFTRMKTEELEPIPTINSPTLEQLNYFSSHVAKKKSGTDGVVSRSRGGAKRNVPFGGHFFKVVSKLPLDPIRSSFSLGSSVSAPDLFQPTDSKLDQKDPVEKVPVMIIVGLTEGSLLAWKLELLCYCKKPTTVLEANIHFKSVHSTHIVQFDQLTASKTDLLMSLSADGMLKLWQPPLLGRMGHLNTATGDHMSMLSCMALLTSKLLAVGYEDGKLAIWKIENLDTPEDTLFLELAVPTSHERRVSAIVPCASAPDRLECEFLTCSFDMNVILWSVDATKRVEEKRYFEVGGAILDLVIDGNYAIAALPHQIQRFVFRAEGTLDHKRALKVLAHRRKSNVYIHRSAIVGNNESMYEDDIPIKSKDQKKQEEKTYFPNPTDKQHLHELSLSIEIPKSKEFATSMVASTTVIARSEVEGVEQINSAPLLMVMSATAEIPPPVSSRSLNGWGTEEADGFSSVDNDVLLAFLYQYVGNSGENGTIQVEQLANFMELYMKNIQAPATYLKAHLSQNKIPPHSRFDAEDALNIMLSLQTSINNSKENKDLEREASNACLKQSPAEEDRHNADGEDDNSGGPQVIIGMMTREEDRQRRRQMVLRRRQQEKERSRSAATPSNAISKAFVTYNILGEPHVKWVPVPAGMPSKKEPIKSNDSINVIENANTDKEQSIMLSTSVALAQRREIRRRRVSIIDSMKPVPIEYPSPDLMEIIQIPRGLEEFWTEGYCWCGSNGSPLIRVVWLAADSKEKNKTKCQICKKHEHNVFLDREQYTCSFPIRSVLSIIHEVYDSLLAPCHAFLYKRWNNNPKNKPHVSIYDALIKIFKNRYGMQEVVEEKIKLFLVSLSHFFREFDSVAVFAELLQVFRFDSNCIQIPEALIALCLSCYAWFYSRETVINGSLVTTGLAIPTDIHEGRTSCFQFVTLQSAMLCAQEMLQYPLVSPSFLQNILAFMKQCTQRTLTRPTLVESNKPDQYQEQTSVLYMELHRFMRILIVEFKDQAAEMKQVEKFLFLDATPHMQKQVMKQLLRESNCQSKSLAQQTEIEEAAQHATIASAMSSNILERLRLILTCFILFDHSRTGTVEQQDFMQLFRKLRYLWPTENLTREEEASEQDETNASVAFETAVIAACRRYADFEHDGQVCYLDFWALFYLVGLKSGTLVKFCEIPSFCQDFKLEMTEEMRHVLITYMQRVSVLLLPKGFDISTSSFDEDALLQHRRRVGGLHDGTFAIDKSQQLSYWSERLVQEYTEKNARSIRRSIKNEKGYEFALNGMKPPTIQSLSTKATERFQDINYQEEHGESDYSNNKPRIDFSQGPVVVTQRHSGPTKKEPAILRISNATIEENNKQVETFLPETRSMMVLDPKSLHAPVVPSESKAGNNEPPEYSNVYIQFPHVDPRHRRVCLSGDKRRSVTLRKFKYQSADSLYEENYHELLMSLQEKETISLLNQFGHTPSTPRSSTSSPLRLSVHKSRQRSKTQHHKHIKRKVEVEYSNTKSPSGTCFSDASPGSFELNMWELPTGDSTEQVEQDDDSGEVDDNRPFTSQTERRDSSEASTAKDCIVKHGSIDAEDVKDRDKDDEEFNGEEGEEEEGNEDEEMDEEAEEVKDDEGEDDEEDEEDVEEIQSEGNDIEEKNMVKVDDPDNQKSNETIHEEAIAANAIVQEALIEPKATVQTVTTGKNESQAPRGLRFSQQLDFGPTVALVNPHRTKGWTPLDASSDEDEPDMDNMIENVNPSVAEDVETTAKSTPTLTLALGITAFRRPNRGKLKIGRLDKEAERTLYGGTMPTLALGEGILFSEQMEKDMSQKWQKFFNEAEDKMFRPIKEKIDAVANRINEEEELQNKLVKRAMQYAQNPNLRVGLNKSKKKQSDEEKVLSSSPNEGKMNFRLRRLARETSLAEQIQLTYGETIEGIFTDPAVQYYHFEYIPKLHGSILTLKLHVEKGNAEVFMSTKTKAPCVSDFMWRSTESNLGKAFGEGQKIVLYPQELSRLQSQIEKEEEDEEVLKKNDVTENESDYGCEGDGLNSATANLQKNKKRKTPIVFYVTVSALESGTKFTLGIMSSGHKREVSQAIRTVDELLERFDVFATAVKNSKHVPIGYEQNRKEQEEQEDSSNSTQFSESQNHTSTGNQKMTLKTHGLYNEPQINELNDEETINGRKREIQASQIKLIEEEQEQESQAFRQLLESISRKRGFEEKQKSFCLAESSNENHEFVEDEEKKLERIQFSTQQQKQQPHDNKIPLSAMELAVQKRLLQKLSPLKSKIVKVKDTEISESLDQEEETTTKKAKPRSTPLGLRLSNRTPLPIAYSLSKIPKQYKR